MVGLRFSGNAALPELFGPPFGLSDAEAEQSNVWIGRGGTTMRITPYIDPTCTSPPCGDQMLNPVLSPDGTLVAFTDFDPDDNAMSLYVIPADGTATYPLSPTFRIYDEPDGWWLMCPSWHPAGTGLLFTNENFGPNPGTLGGKIQAVTYPGGVATDLWTPQTQSPTQREEAFRPVYSPDGSKIAFLVNLEAGGGGDYTRQGLWVMDADGSNDQQIDGWVTALDTDSGYLFGGSQFAWSNDGEWIAYVDRGFGGGPATSGTFSLWKIRPDGTDKTMLADGDAGGGLFVPHHVAWGAWLDDDSGVIFTEQGVGGWGIRLAAPDGSGSTELVAYGDGPPNAEYFDNAYRLRDRIYWHSVVAFDGAEIKSCALDGSDVQVYSADIPPGSQFFNGDGFEYP